MLFFMSNRSFPAQATSRKYLFDAFFSGLVVTEAAGEIATKLGKLSQTINIERGSMAPLDPERDSLVYIGNGATKLIASASSGREQIVAFQFAGDLVSIPASASHSYALCALVDTDVLAFPADELLAIIGSEPILLYSLLQQSLTALHRCRDKAVGLGRKNAQERLASFLVGMSDRIGFQEPDGCMLDLPMLRRDIGDSLGLTIETISRQFSDLRSAGLVETTGRSRVLLRDLPALAKRAGHI